MSENDVQEHGNREDVPPRVASEPLGLVELLTFMAANGVGVSLLWDQFKWTCSWNTSVGNVVTYADGPVAAVKVARRAARARGLI